MAVKRFGVSLEQDLLESLDNFAEQYNLSNRSQAIRKLINTYTVSRKWKSNSVVAGSITLIYDHHKHNLLKKLTDVQHDYNDTILSSLHFHLEHDLCMEIIAVKGKADLITKLADKLIYIKGIQHGKLTMTKAD
jgi:CopG family nickel-responsive transcriptional regulator